MRYFSAFTGAGGFEQGLPLEWECVGMSEIDKYASMVLRYHWPDIKNYGDICAIRWNDKRLRSGKECDSCGKCHREVGTMRKSIFSWAIKHNVNWLFIAVAILGLGVNSNPPTFIVVLSIVLFGLAIS